MRHLKQKSASLLDVHAPKYRQEHARIRGMQSSIKSSLSPGGFRASFSPAFQASKQLQLSEWRDESLYYADRAHVYSSLLFRGVFQERVQILASSDRSSSRWHASRFFLRSSSDWIAGFFVRSRSPWL
jgi:hypothetical protein